MIHSHSSAYVRTEAGRSEVTAHRIRLSRPARNLLHVIDGSSTAHEWIARVHGSSLVDLDLLISENLIAPKIDVQRAAAPLPASTKNWTYGALYKLLTRESKERFGLFKGYLLILKIEACSNLEELQSVARDFVKDIRSTHGEEAAERFLRQLNGSE